MLWWSNISVLGGLNVTALGALAIAVWLGAARCWRLALAWCLLFGAAMLRGLAQQFVPSPLLVALSLVILLLPKAEPANAHQWVVRIALTASGHEQAFTKRSWAVARAYQEQLRQMRPAPE